MKFTKSLIKGKLIKRYKRFFVDINIGKEIITAHCPNTGSMMGLLDNGNEVFVSKSDNPKRKLKYTLEIIKVKKNLIGINTHLANKITYHGLNNNLINELKNTKKIKSEVFFNKENRFDFLIENKKEKIFVEVKNVTLLRKPKTAEFPDSITSRGSKHLKTLINTLKKGYKAYLLYLIQIEDIDNFKIAKDIDAEYYKNFLIAKKAGIKFLAYSCRVNKKEIEIYKKLKII